ncbi:MAG: phosphate/phosphite/phosphonate ABC transporter substrate-binding protein [Chloroflexi bacterium]|nr:phosphate/phosphite/phosphonate ABC transporter substrate-binding protein [Chloroflexota bacterium]
MGRLETKPLLLTVSLSFLLALASACGHADTPGTKTVRIGIVPKESPEKTAQDFEAFVQYLRDETRLDIQYFVPTDYTAVVEAMAAKRIEVSYFGALTYVQASNKVPVHPFVKGVIGGSSEYHSVMITTKESSIKSIQEVKGHTLAFGDVSSTSGHLIPHKALLAAGVDPDRDLKESPFYTGAHNATALAVYNGKVEVGAVEEPVLVNMAAIGLIDMSRLRVIWRSEPIPQYPWVIRDDVPTEIEEALKRAFLNAPREVIPPTVAEGFVGASADDYLEIRRAAEELGLAGIRR